MIRFSDVSFSYRESKECVLKNINFEIEDGECVLFSGKSGCGKSTLLMLINGIIPDHVEGNLNGEVFVNGYEVKNNSVQKMAETVGSVFQNPKSQFFHLNTTDEVLFSCSNKGIDKYEMRKRLKNTTNLFHIEKLLNRSIFELSGGEKQKIACASVYAGSPDVFVFDEPSANLDQEAIRELSDIIKRIKAEGHTVIIAEHRIYYLMDICDRVIYMDNGSITKEYSITDFKNISEAERMEKGLRSLNYKDIVCPYIEKSEFENAIKFKNLEYMKDNQNILSIPEMSIQMGKIIAVTGKNGVGKSTFAGCLCGINKCRGIIIEGKELKEKRRNKIFNLVMQDVNHQLFSESVIDEFFIIFNRNDSKKVAEAKELLKRLDLSDFLECHPMSLSGGQKQRLVVGISIFECKEYIIFDEPTSGLDYQNMVSVAKLIRELRNSAKLIFVITHDIEFLNLCCDNYFIMDNGSIANP